MKRKAGVLLNVSSLPGQYGIGSFTGDVEKFLGEMAFMGFKVWQTLPITSAGAGDSPYSGVSSFAGNFLYIDPEKLFGLLNREDIEAAKYRGDIYLTDYAFAHYAKKEALEKAYSRIDDGMREKLTRFAADNAYWLPDYAAYMALREKFNGAIWTEWGEYADYSVALRDRAIEELKDRVYYYYFEQYAFFTQWAGVRDCAKSYNIEIFGDLPIYVSYDSVDVWAHTELFLLDENYKPTEVAGVPPDYFAEDGQLWNNPLYNYDVMKKDGYKWWVERLKHALKLYDILRIDHFRGLYEYWAVPAGETTAKNGKWKKGPNTAIFDELKKVVPDHNIVAEDLGLIDDKVAAFLKKCGYYGMRVMQFGFDGDSENTHLPHNYAQECVAYTGTHDNDTTLGWLLNLDANTRQMALDYVGCDADYGWASGGGRCRATKAFIKALLASTARLAIVPMQDLCGYGSDTRMNIPGMAWGCWKYRTNYSAIDNIDREFIRNTIRIYGR